MLGTHTHLKESKVTLAIVCVSNGFYQAAAAFLLVPLRTILARPAKHHPFCPHLVAQTTKSLLVCPLRFLVLASVHRLAHGRGGAEVATFESIRTERRCFTLARLWRFQQSPKSLGDLVGDRADDWLVCRCVVRVLRLADSRQEAGEITNGKVGGKAIRHSRRDTLMFNAHREWGNTQPSSESNQRELTLHTDLKGLPLTR